MQTYVADVADGIQCFTAQVGFLHCSKFGFVIGYMVMFFNFLDTWVILQEGWQAVLLKKLSSISSSDFF